MVEVIKSGFYSSIQDLGRFGYREFGVPVSGAMDMYSSRFANTVLNNDRNDAVLEMTMTGAALKFNVDTQICISGADMSPMLNESTVALNKIHTIEKGTILSFGILKSGFRCYLAVKGGFNTETVMGSRSFYEPVTEQGVLKSGNKIKIKATDKLDNIKHASVKFDNSVFKEKTLEVHKGPEFHMLSDHQQSELLNTHFRISKFHSRMAYQLDQKLKNSLKSIITSSVLPGTVQLTPSGQLMILSRDCQTTGGYPRVLQLTEKALNILGQKQAGNELKFRLTE